MERKAYPVDEKLFDLLLEEDFDRLNIDELQGLFDNFPYEISNKWVFISDKTEREYQSESENYEVDDFFHSQGLYGYKYFSLIDYGDDSTYRIGIPDVSRFDDDMDRQKCVIMQLLQAMRSEDVINLKKYIFNRLASGTQINNYLISNVKQILVKSFTDFFHDEFDKIQNQVERFNKTNNLTEDKNHPFFITYNVDPKQTQDHKKVVLEQNSLICKETRMGANRDRLYRSFYFYGSFPGNFSKMDCWTAIKLKQTGDILSQPTNYGCITKQILR